MNPRQQRPKVRLRGLPASVPPRATCIDAARAEGTAGAGSGLGLHTPARALLPPPIRGNSGHGPLPCSCGLEAAKADFGPLLPRIHSPGRTGRHTESVVHTPVGGAFLASPPGC